METTPPLGQCYQVRGCSLLTHRSGDGAPPVVLLPGGGAVGLDDWNLQAAAAELTTSIVYDGHAVTRAISDALVGMG